MKNKLVIIDENLNIIIAQKDEVDIKSYRTMIANETKKDLLHELSFWTTDRDKQKWVFDKDYLYYKGYMIRYEVENDKFERVYCNVFDRRDKECNEVLDIFEFSIPEDYNDIPQQIIKYMDSAFMT